MRFGILDFRPVEDHLDLVAEPIQRVIKKNGLRDILVAKIDPDLSDTAAFCEAYQISLDVSVNCVIVAAKRAERTWYAACLIPATQRADINGIVRRELNARRTSFAPMETATSLSGMAYGGISPLGLPDGWPILIGADVTQLPRLVIGSGIRESKLLVSGSLLTGLPNAKILPLVKSS